MTPATTTTFRDSGYAMSPTWLKSYWSSRFLYSLWVMYDALADSAGYAILARFPSRAPDDALPWISRDRQIAPGPNETTTSLRARLIQWLDLWRHAGSSTGLLLALRAYLYPLLPRVVAVNSSGHDPIPNMYYSCWDTYDAGVVPFPPGASEPTAPSHRTIIGANWTWDGASQPYYYPWMWWRKWLIIYSPAGDPNSPWAAPTSTWSPASGTVTVSVVSDATYGSVYSGSGGSGSASTEFYWDDGTCWDWTGTSQEAASLSLIASTWKSAGCWIPWIIVSYDNDRPSSGFGAGGGYNPDSSFGYWGKVVSDATYGTVYIAARWPSSTATCIVGTNDGANGQPLGVG